MEKETKQSCKKNKEKELKKQELAEEIDCLEQVAGGMSPEMSWEFSPLTGNKQEDE